MFRRRDFNKISFKGVGMALILFGIVIFSASLAEWILISCGATARLIAYPFFKAICGIMILGVGYIILELELLRDK